MTKAWKSILPDISKSILKLHEQEYLERRKQEELEEYNQEDLAADEIDDLREELWALASDDATMHLDGLRGGSRVRDDLRVLATRDAHRLVAGGKGRNFALYQCVRRDTGSVARPAPGLFGFLWARNSTQESHFRKLGEEAILKEHIIPRLAIPIPPEAEYHYTVNPIHWYIAYETEVAISKKLTSPDYPPESFYLGGSDPDRDGVAELRKEYLELHDIPSWPEIVKKHEKELGKIINGENHYAAGELLPILYAVFLKPKSHCMCVCVRARVLIVYWKIRSARGFHCR